MSSSAIALPIATALPPGLAFLASPISNYFYSQPPYNNVTLEALILTPPPQPPRILLLQRVGGADPHAFSNYWQVPSGKPIFSDPTMVHAIARIVREQTGLELSHVATMSGTETGPASWKTGNMQWMRMLFMVEVAELANLSTPSSPHPESLAFDDDQGSGNDLGQELDLGAVPLIMDKKKHRLHVWAMEEDLKEFIKSGLYPTEEATQYQVMLEAFAFYRQDFAQLECLRQTRQNSVFNQGFGP